MSDTFIVVITRDRVGLLRRCIASLLKSDIGDAHLLVIDNGSVDGTQKWLKTVDRIDQVITNPRDTPQWQKAYALRQAYKIFDKMKGKHYFCWIDDDMTLKPKWLKAGRMILDERKDVHVAAMHNDALQRSKHKASVTTIVGPYEVDLKHTSNGPVWLVHKSFIRKYGLPPVTGKTDGGGMSDRYYDKKLYRCGKWIGVVDMSTHLGYKNSLRMILQGKRKALKKR